MNKDLKVLLLKQACEDIKANAEDIIGSTKYNKSLSIEISFKDEDEIEIPTIIINKEFPISFSEEIDWHPTIEMASKSYYDIHTSERTIVKLYSEVDYTTNTLNYSVSESTDGGTCYWKFNRLNDAVDCYNERLST